MDSTKNDISAAVEAGKEAVHIDNRIFYVDEVIPIGLVPSGQQFQILTEALKASDERADAPRRLKGTAVHQEVDSFIKHVNRFKSKEDSVIFADSVAVKLTAIFNYHTVNHEPQWGDHRSLYVCPLSDQWKLWLGRNEKPMSQDEFGQFIEDNMADLRAGEQGEDFPPPARVLEIARKLSIQTRGTFERSVNVTTGEVTLINKVENDPATSTRMPRAFLIGIPVFESGEAYRLEARWRFSLGNGGPKFAYSLYQPDEVKRHAFGEVRAKAEKETELPLFCGVPE